MPETQKPFYKLSSEEAARDLGGDIKNGLNRSEVDVRLAQYGRNELKIQQTPLIKKIVEPFKSVFVYVLLFAAGISLLLGEMKEAIVVLVIVAINAIIYYVQQTSTDRVLKQLRETEHKEVRVRRNGHEKMIDGREVVPGDIMFVEVGDKLVADGRVVAANALRVDESVLTGESEPEHKREDAIHEDAPIADRENMGYAGTTVVQGTGWLLVTATGAHTEFSRITELTATADMRSPLQDKIDRLSKLIAAVILVVSVGVFALAWHKTGEPLESLRFVLSLAVSAIPEGLPVALTVVFVLAMKRMAAKNALVRSMQAVENLGLVTAIATDKTGTLTTNRLILAEAWSADERRSVSEAAIYAIAGDSEHFGESIDKVLAEIRGDRHGLKMEYIKELPFDQSQRLSGALWQDGAQNKLIVKGAPETLLQHCHLDTADRKRVQQQLEEFVSGGSRVLAVAASSWPAVHNKEVVGVPLQSIGKFEFLGLLALNDEIRDEAASSIKDAESAGIRVLMITGDHFETGYHIGKRVGIANSRAQVVDGSQMTADQIVAKLESTSVVARSTPEQKFAILRALKQKHITAMTGDGVNDVPALAEADVGLAMGSGTDAAKTAGDMVLLDDNFKTIIEAVRYGRSIYANIQKMLYYLFATSFAEVIAIVTFLLTFSIVPFSPVQILWVNLITDTFCVLPIGLERAERHQMQHKPRPINAPILTRLLIERIFIVSFSMAAVVVGVYWLVSQFHNSEIASTATFGALVAAQWANAFVARSEIANFWRMRPNWLLVGSVSVAASLQALVLFTPLGGLLNLPGPIPPTVALGSAIGAFSVVIVVGELHKLLRRRRGQVTFHTAS